MINSDHISKQVPIASVLPETAVEGTCPFCKAGRFRLSVERGFCSCPDCGEKGDVITATMKLEGVNFRSAIDRLTEHGKASGERNRKISDTGAATRPPPPVLRNQKERE